MQVPRRPLFLLFASLLGATTVPAHGYNESCSGGLCTQQFALVTGWNAVWLEVQPEADDSETVFSGLPLASVWTWNPRSSVEFVQDPSEERLQMTDFLGYFPPERPESFVNNLQAVKAHRPYLIRVTSPATWTVTGRPSLRAPRWLPSSYNLVGVPVDPAGAAPSLQTFFRGSAAHAGRAAFRLAANGTWNPIAPGDLLRTGEAFWIWTEGGSGFQGPFDIEIPLKDGLDFGASLERLPLRVYDRDLTPLALTFEPGAALGELAYEESRERSDQAPATGWPPVPASLPLAVELDRPWMIELGVRRSVATVALEAVATLRGQGVRRWIPFSVEPGAGTMPIADPNSPTGLWVGTILLTRVAEIHSPAAPAPPLPDPATYLPCACGARLPECTCVCGVDEEGSCNSCGAAMQLRVLFHVDGAGDVRLLKEVVQACERNPALPNERCDVLATDAARVAGLEGVSKRGGEAVPVRLSAAGFDFDAAQADATGGLPVGSNGGFGPGASLDAALEIPWDHPTNPYRHAFHRDLGGSCGCDPISPSYPACIDECAERFRFPLARSIELVFDTADPTVDLSDPDSEPRLDWRTRRLSGCYSEQITGLHRLPVNFQGTFRLTRVSTVATLK
jgi:hypothetical protein